MELLSQPIDTSRFSQEDQQYIVAAQQQAKEWLGEQKG